MLKKLWSIFAVRWLVHMLAIAAGVGGFLWLSAMYPLVTAYGILGLVIVVVSYIFALIKRSG